MTATLTAYAVTWSPALPALRHKVETTVVEAYSRDGAATAVANDYPAPIHVYSVKQEARPSPFYCAACGARTDFPSTHCAGAAA